MWKFQEWENIVGFQGKIEVEIPIIFNGYFSLLDFINEDISEIHFLFLWFLNGIWFSIQIYRVVENVSNTFDIQTYRLSSSLNVANNVVVELLWYFGFKKNFNFRLSLWTDDSTHWLDCKGVSPLHLSLDWCLIKREGKRNIFKIFKANKFLVFSSKKKGTKVYFAGIEKYIRLDYISHNEEMLNDIFIRNLEGPITFVTTYQIRGVLKDHFSFFAAKNGTFRY